MYRLTPFLLAAGASLAAAQSSQEVVTVFLVQADQQPLVASMIHSDATATTLHIECAPGTDSSDCGFPSGAVVTVGPSTFRGTYSAPGVSLTVIPDCKLSGSPATLAQCEQVFVGPQGAITAPGATSIATTGDATVITSSTASASFGESDIAEFVVAVTITAGAENTGGAEGGSASQTSRSEGSESASASATGAAASASGSEAAGAPQMKGREKTAVGLGIFGVLLSLL